MKRFVCLLLTATALVLFAGKEAPALEYQWKLVLPELNDRASAVRIFAIIEQIPGIEDIDVNIERNWLTILYDDERTSLDMVKTRLQESGFSVQRTMLLEEPREGLMN